MCRPPSCLTAVSTMRSPKSGAVTLPLHVTARPPSCSTSDTVSFAGSSSRSLTTTCAPSRANRKATSRPMPRPDPVTMATFPSSKPMGTLRVMSWRSALASAACPPGMLPDHEPLRKSRPGGYASRREECMGDDQNMKRKQDQVEAFLMTHPGVGLAAVVGYPDARLSEVAVAFVRCEPGHALTADELIGHCRGRIASFKVPRHVVFVDEFPMTSSGKIQKTKLREEAL